MTETMAQLECLILMAEDELTQYSTDARKIEKLRQKINLSVPLAEQRQVKSASWPRCQQMPSANW